MSRYVLPPPGRHQCDLPATDRNRPLNTLARCKTCPRWWRWQWPADDFVGSWAMPDWQPVRWYHWRLRRRINAVPIRRGSRAA